MEVLDATGLAERLRWEDNEYWLHLEAESPFEKYPAKQHARRVQEKLGVDEGLIYLPGQAARNNKDSDMPAPFRQLRYFYYLSGCNEADCHLTYDIRHDTLTLFIPRIKPERVIWYGRGSNPGEALAKYDIDQVFYSDELEAFIQDWALCYGNRDADILVLHQSSRVPGYHQSDPRIDLTSLQPSMNVARMIKDDHEIGLIRKANDISSQAHREVLANVLTFKNEAQVQGVFMDVCISHQAKQQAYDPIAASGPNAGTLHYDANNEDLVGRQLMCLDAGCEYELYASDITRTFPLASSWPSKEAESIYKLVQRMQETCIERLAPGVRYLDLHIMAHQIAIDGLLQLGILHNGTKEEIFKAGTSRAFFPHGLGHHVGLEVHDVGQVELMSVRRGKLVYEQAPSLYPANFHQPVYDTETCHAPTDPQSSHLEEGMVVTVEPGIYFSVYALQHFYLPSPIHSKYINVDVLQRYLPVGGARIEDDVLITSKGYENLTTAPKGDAMLEIIRHGKSNRTAVSDPKPVSTSRRRSVEVEPPLVRAPGISNSMSQPIQRPLARAATMPAEFKQQEDVDFEPFAGPSLFSNFTRSMTTEEKIQQWRQKRDPVPATQSTPPTVKQLHPVCGEPTRNVQHVYLSNASSLASLSQSAPEFESPAMCKNCVILVQTLDRLRQNLTAPGQSSPKLQIEPVFEATVEARNRFTKDEGHAKELHTGESARTMRLQRELPIRNSVAPHAGPIQTATQFSTKYTPSQVSQPVSSRNPFKPTSPLRVQPASGTEHVTSRHLGRRTTDHSSTAQRRNPARLPVPSALAPASDTRDSLHKYEALRLRLEALEEGARVRAQRQEHPTRSHRPPMSRPSMPNLMSHNPWQQHDTQLVQEPHNPFQARSSQNSPQRHNLRSQVSRMNTSNMRPAAPTNKRSVNLEALMVDGERIDQREREQRQERLQHEALRRNRYFTR